MPIARSRLVPLLVAALALAGCQFLSGYAEGHSSPPHGTFDEAPGVVQFLFNDFHGLTTDTLNTNAAPWKLTAAAVLTYRRSLGEPLEESEQGFKDVLTHRYGFLQPTSLANWPLAEPQPTLTKPLGIVSGYIERSVPRVVLEASNQGCTTCHANNLWDAQGAPLPTQAWLGAPSTSINLERYASELYQALLYARDHEPAVIATLDRLYPQLPADERHTLIELVLPRLADKMTELERTLHRFQPYVIGGSGLINGVAAQEVNNHLVPRDHFLADEVAFTSIPDFGGLRLKTSLLYDGVVVAPGLNRYGPLPEQLDPARHEQLLGQVATLFTVGTLGIDPQIAPENIPAVVKTVQFAVEQYAPAPFPGPIDAAKATSGRALFHQRCAQCHGTYSEGIEKVRLLTYPNKPVALDVIQTDPVRVRITSHLQSDRLAKLPLSAGISFAETTGYLPPPLTGLWMSAPYLHNGSVPTLWHLMHPEARPAKFQVGGHRLDYTRVGIAGEQQGDTWVFPANYQPWTLPDLYDTTQPGHGNGGHTTQFRGLDEGQKDALLEYLKLL